MTDTGPPPARPPARAWGSEGAQPYHPRGSGQGLYQHHQQQRGGAGRGGAERGEYGYYQPGPPRGYYQQHGNRDNGAVSGGDRGRRYVPNANGGEQPASDAPPRDMETLKAAISAAEAGTGAVGRALSSSTFRPRARAFTSLIQMCGKVR